MCIWFILFNLVFEDNSLWDMGNIVKKRDRACALVGRQCHLLDYQWTFYTLFSFYENFSLAFELEDNMKRSFVRPHLVQKLMHSSRESLIILKFDEGALTPFINHRFLTICYNLIFGYENNVI